MLLSKIVETWDCILYSVYNFLMRIIYIIKYYSIKKVVGKNKELRNSHMNERCFIVLNGPSINTHDLSKLKNEIVFTTNYFYKSDLVKDIAPDFHCWLDSKDPSNKEKWELIQKEIMERCKGVKLIVNVKAFQNSGNNKNIYYTYNKLKATKWSVGNNISGVCSSFFTVAWYAINSAIYMGFSKIYILGLDFAPGAFKLFSDLTIKDTDFSMERDKTKVCGDYWQYTQAQYESYWIAKEARKHNVEVINLNPGSYIRAFSFDEYENIIS